MADNSKVQFSVRWSIRFRLSRSSWAEYCAEFDPCKPVSLRLSYASWDGWRPSLTSTSLIQTCFSLSFNFMQFLSRVMLEFDHYIPNADLSSLQSVGDVVVFFSTPVRDTTLYEDLSKLDLPPNLHIQMEPVRFDPETDTMFGGVTAFPGRPTVVSSLRFRRKYGKKDPEWWCNSRSNKYEAFWCKQTVWCVYVYSRRCNMK